MTEEIKPMPGLTPGRVVHYVISAKDGLKTSVVDEIRSATIVKVHDPEKGTATLNVNINGFHDAPYHRARDGMAGEPWQFPTNLWAPSKRFSEGREPGTWHWIPRDEAKPTQRPRRRSAAR